LKKNIGWFDDRNNAPGILNSVLAKDVQSLNGASTEGIAAIMESSFSIIVALALGFSFHWKISLIALGSVPFLAIGGAINTKFQSGYSSNDEDSYKKANLLAGDTILNYKTVASFGYDYLIIKEYDKMVEEPIKESFKKAQIIGFWYGFSQFIQNAVFALLYWSGAKFQVEQGSQDGANISIATFAIMLGSFAAGQAN
jgi:ABC-type multidrug transport system fused ATPase/permease subunit